MLRNPIRDRKGVIRWYRQRSVKRGERCNTLHVREMKYRYIMSNEIITAALNVVIGHVRYINIQAWLRGFRVKIANFSIFFCPLISMRDLYTKETTPNIEV